MENKFFGEIQNHPNQKFESNQAIEFLISGTLTPVYGVIEAIYWFVEILKIYPNYHLKIVGHFPLKSYGNELRELASKVPEISLDISEFPVDYKQILGAYKTGRILQHLVWEDL